MDTLGWLCLWAGIAAWKGGGRVVVVKDLAVARARRAPDDTPADDLWPCDVLFRDGALHLGCDPAGGLVSLAGRAWVLHPDGSVTVRGALCPSEAAGRTRWTLVLGVWRELARSR